MAVLLLYSISLASLALNAGNAEKKENFKVISNAIAESGIQKALWCLNQTSGTNCSGTFGGNYTGEADVSFGGGIFDTTVSDVNGSTKLIESTGYYPNKTRQLSKSTVRVKAAINTDITSFNYGMQVGYGGITMGNNAMIDGSVFSHGDIIGGNGSEITGDAYVAGGTALQANQLWTVKNADFIFGKTNPQIDIAQSFVPSETNVLNKISIYAKKTGSAGNIYIKIVNDNDGIPGTEVISSATIPASLVSSSYGWVDADFSNPPPVYSGNKYWIILDISQSSTKYYTIGADAFDGFPSGTMLYAQNWSSDSWTLTGGDANFKVWLGGVETGIYHMEIGGNAYAHYISHSEIGGDVSAYNLYSSNVDGNVLAYNIENSVIGESASTTDIFGSTVGHDLWCQNHSLTTTGWHTYCPTSVNPPADPGPSTMPISDSLINEWKSDAETGGIIGSQTINTNTSMGPKKINGNLIISTGKILTLTGSVYVTGSIIISGGGAGIVLDSSYGSSSGVIIADGIISIGNNTLFSGAGDGSYLMTISTMNSSTENAISVGNTFNGAIFYAPYGIISLGNNSNFKEVCAYGLTIGNDLILDYEFGMAEIYFSSGPSGGWSELKGSWTIVE